MIALTKRQCLAPLLALVFAISQADGQDKNSPPAKAADSFNGVVAYDSLARKAPAAGMIGSARNWAALLTAWDLKIPFEVDFNNQIVVVGTSQGSTVKLITELLDGGNLQARVIGSADLQPGFRYVLKRIDRTGIKTFNGKALPKE